MGCMVCCRGLSVIALSVCLVGCLEVKKIPDFDSVEYKQFDKKVDNIASEGFTDRNIKDYYVSSVREIPRSELNYNVSASFNGYSLYNIKWTPEVTYLDIDFGSSKVAVINNGSTCANGVGAQLLLGILTNGQGTCTDYNYTYDYMYISTGNESFPIKYHDKKDAQYTASGNTSVPFPNVPLYALRNFYIDGLGWDSSYINVGDPVEVELVKSDFVKILGGEDVSLGLYKYLYDKSGGYRSLNNIVTNSLSQHLRKLESVESYVHAIDFFQSSEDVIESIKTNYLIHQYESYIKPMNNPIAIEYYMEEYGAAVPKEVYESWHDDSVTLEMGKIEKYISNIKNLSFFDRMYYRIIEDTNEKDAVEDFVRSYYSEMINNKNNGHAARARVMFDAIVKSESANSSAKFDIQKDSEMKEFLQGNFDRLIKSNNDNADKINESIVSSSNEILKALAEISANTTTTPETREEERQRNINAAADSYWFHKTVLGSN